VEYFTDAGTTIPFGVGVGTAIAGILGWFYVIYFWLTRTPGERKQP
jgi:hypothetical protein